MPEKWSKLLTSRKVWLALVLAIAAGLAFAQGAISLDQFVDAVVALFVAVIVAIGIEDHGLRSSGR